MTFPHYRKYVLTLNSYSSEINGKSSFGLAVVQFLELDYSPSELLLKDRLSLISKSTTNIAFSE